MTEDPENLNAHRLQVAVLTEALKFASEAIRRPDGPNCWDVRMIGHLVFEARARALAELRETGWDAQERRS